MTYILSDIVDSAPVNIVYVYSRDQQEDSYMCVAVQEGNTGEVDRETLEQWLSTSLKTLPFTDQVIRMQTPHYQECLFYTLSAFDEDIGVVVILPKSEGFDPAQIKVHLHLIQTILENMHLIERLIITEAIAVTAQAIAQNPSPQNIVDVLRDYLFDGHVVSCAIGFFGPIQPDTPAPNYEYIEVQGSWSRRLGSQIGIGKRFDIRQYDALIEYLELENVYTISKFSPDLLPDLDEYIRIILQVDRVQAALLLMLRSDGEKVGILAITVNRPYEFPQYELRSYQITSEFFLTMTSRAASFQKQIDFAQQGRAAMLSAVTDGVVMVLPNEEASIFTVNDRFAELFHLHQNDLLGVSMWAVLEEIQVPKTLRVELYEKWQHHKGYHSGEFQVANIKGVIRAFQWGITPVYQGDDILGYVYTFHDITPERAAEHLRSELVSRLSHELRTPLTSIHGFAEFILEADGDSLSPLTREYTEIILKSAEHLNTMFTDLIEVTRANIGELELHREIMPIKNTVINTLQSFQKPMSKRKQEMQIHIDDDLPLTHIDPERIGQVLYNMVHNAMKFSPEASTITIIVRGIRSTNDLWIELPQYIQTPYVVIGVIDTGPGIVADEIKKIFLPFYRAAYASRNKIEGGGLGLAIARSIVELHDGLMWAEPATHEQPGGRFYFALPGIEHD